MPQFLLRDEDFDFIKQLVAETVPSSEEAGCLLTRMNNLSLEFLENRIFVEQAKKEVEDLFRFSIDFDAEVFWVDPHYAWVNGWYLVKRE